MRQLLGESYYTPSGHMVHIYTLYPSDPPPPIPPCLSLMLCTVREGEKQEDFEGRRRGEQLRERERER